MIAPFRVEIPEHVLADLHQRLDRTRWPDELPGTGRDYGLPRAWLRELTRYWREDYDWRAQEERLNALPQYTTEIDGQRVHFLHLRSARQDALPLLLTHGWPGSIVEFLDVLEPLAERFHLVIPSIPGFGFSGPTRERGWDVHRVARALAELMRRLGYRRYGAQGGDWGSAISRALGALAPEAVVGVHLSYLPTPPPAEGAGELSAADQRRLAGIREYLARRPGYQVMQETEPQTLAYGMADSPVGQLALIAARFAEWTDPEGEISFDRLLTNVMLYWLTGTAASSSRLRWESARGGPGGSLACPVPVGVAVFAHDITLPVRAFAERSYRITHWSEFDRGGHFPALEVPGSFAADVGTFFG
ncbi:epoxide hydrolase family protein [Amycolatopsis aidingensis]|uniref:epoxide hydrolase family protein n=1 Tax=Amycolatopsis aidingensis TaxID=2842453 RepID=UPI001C0CC1DE|nr:epoxide hydrolase [Amycolatopsis aidingensis]